MSGRPVVVLLDPPHAAPALARLRGQAGLSPLEAPDGGTGAAWAWLAGLRLPARPLVLAAHAGGLREHIAASGADFLVAVPDSVTAAGYADLANVRAVVVDDAAELADLALAGLRAPAPIPDPFALLAALPAMPLPEVQAGSAPDRFRPPPSAPLSRHALLGGQARRRPAGEPTGIRRWSAAARLGRPRRTDAGPALAAAALARKPLLIAVASRKGGVGKTAGAAAIASVLGPALDGLGHSAALVDGNVGNPDAWGRLDVPAGATTVREIIGRIGRGEEPPAPLWSRTAGLAVYPESREVGAGYTAAEIQRLAAYLRVRHAVVVVDLPNRLPAFTSAEAAIAAAWIAEAAVVVLPATADPAALAGVREYLESGSLAGMPAIVPYIVPRLRALREAAELRALLTAITAAGGEVVELPDDDRATLAMLDHVSITEIGGRLPGAYERLTRRVLEAVPGG